MEATTVNYTKPFKEMYKADKLGKFAVFDIDYPAYGDEIEDFKIG